MNELQISFSNESEIATFVAVISWDFDNWCHDGFYRVEGTNLSESEIFNAIYGNFEELEEWEENKHQFPNESARGCTDEEIIKYLECEMN